MNTTTNSKTGMAGISLAAVLCLASTGAPSRVAVRLGPLAVTAMLFDTVWPVLKKSLTLFGCATHGMFGPVNWSMRQPLDASEPASTRFGASVSSM